MGYEIIRSDRKTLALEIRQGRLVVRAPRRASAAAIEDMIRSHARWIETNLARERARAERARACGRLTEARLAELAEQARRTIPQRAAYYAPLVGVTYGRVTIRTQRSKWGSCSAKGNLSFNCLLMLAPPRVLDSVVVHELCHRLRMDHSARFYAEVLRVMPDYREQYGWLKENGGVLMAMAGYAGPDGGPEDGI